MTWLESLATGLGEWLAEQGFGTWSPNDGPEIGSGALLVVGTLPAKPQDVVAFQVYPLRDNPLGTESLVGVQFLFRSSEEGPFSASGRSDALFETLNGAHRLLLRGVPVTLAWRQSSFAPDPDDGGRTTVADTYHMHVSRPSTRWQDDT